MTEKKTTAFETKGEPVEDGFVGYAHSNGENEITDDFLRTFSPRGFLRLGLLDIPLNPFAGAERRVDDYVDRLDLKKYSVEVRVDGKFYSMMQSDEGKTEIWREEGRAKLPLDMPEEDFLAKLREIVRRWLSIVARNFAALETELIPSVCHNLFEEED